MPYLGNIPAVNFSTAAYQDLTGDTGSPTAKRDFTLDHAVGSAQDIEVFVNNVRQEPSAAYTVAGTALTMLGDVETTDDFYVVFQGKAQQTVTPGAGTITNAMFASGTTLGGGSYLGDSGGGLADIVRVHEAQLDTNITVAVNTNGLCAGPLTVATGVTVTVNGNLVIT